MTKSKIFLFLYHVCNLQLQLEALKTNDKKQKLTLAALGLRKLGMTVEHDDTPNILGMINKVSHLVTVEK